MRIYQNTCGAIPNIHKAKKRILKPDSINRLPGIENLIPVTTPTETTTSVIQQAGPYFTKHPTAETVNEGKNAQFVAKADNITGFSWIIMRADGKYTYQGDYYGYF